jgi:hypothetical protein
MLTRAPTLGEAKCYTPTMFSSKLVPVSLENDVAANPSRQGEPDTGKFHFFNRSYLTIAACHRHSSEPETHQGRRVPENEIAPIFSKTE